MKQGLIHIYSGDGHGKSPAALGKAVMAAAAGERVVIIQFLKGRGLQDTEFIRRLEPEIKIFRFEKSETDFVALSEDKKQEFSSLRKTDQLLQTDKSAIRKSAHSAPATAQAQHSHKADRFRSFSILLTESDKPPDTVQE